MAHTQRIDFIDLAKGICITTIIFGHCGINTYISGADTIPLFFLISGMFFKMYEDTNKFFIKKINGLLIPFCFFYITSYVLFYLIKAFAPHLLITSATGIIDVFTNRQFFNGPLWFIIALFWCNIIQYSVFKLTNKEAIRIFFIILIGLVGYILGYLGYFVPMFIDVAMTSLPFFALGYYINKKTILKDSKTTNIAIGIILLLALFLIEYRISLHYNIIEGLNSYIAAFSIAFGILYLCNAINKISYINALGRNSLIPLCVHHMIYRPVKVALQFTNNEIINNDYSVAAITLLLSILCIPLCIKTIPWFVAQKDLIKGK